MFFQCSNTNVLIVLISIALTHLFGSPIATTTYSCRICCRSHIYNVISAYQRSSFLLPLCSWLIVHIADHSLLLGGATIQAKQYCILPFKILLYCNIWHHGGSAYSAQSTSCKNAKHGPYMRSGQEFFINRIYCSGRGWQ